MLNDRRLFLITDISFPSLSLVEPRRPSGCNQNLTPLTDLVARPHGEDLITHLGLDYTGIALAC
jgi:hypothetical protein